MAYVVQDTRTRATVPGVLGEYRCDPGRAIGAIKILELRLHDEAKRVVNARCS